MSILAKCPKCDEAVTIPYGVDIEAVVRCPLCKVEYSLRDAFAVAPPALIPIEATVETGVEQPVEEQLEEPLDQPAVHPVEEEPIIDAWQKVIETPQIDLGYESVEPEEEPVDTSHFASFGQEDEEGEGEEVGAGTARLRRKKKKGKSTVRMVLEPIIGGFLGLAVGYYAINYFGGGRFDYLQIYLPGVQHTYEYKPKFFEKSVEDKAEKKTDEKSGESKQPSLQRPARRIVKAGESVTIRPEPMPEEFPDIELPSESALEPAPELELEPEPLPEDYVGPLNSPSFTSDELGKALKEANDAIYGEDAAGEMTEQAYRKFRRLGHVLTFVKGKQDDTRLADRKLMVTTVLERIAEDPMHVERITRLATDVIENTDGAEGGILLAGAVGNIHEKDGLFGTAIRLAGEPTSVIVMSDRPLPFAAKSQVLLLGGIITNPAENLAGYNGSKEFLIWVGTAVQQ